MSLIDDGVLKCMCRSLPFNLFVARHIIRKRKRELCGLLCLVLLKTMFKALVVAEMLSVQVKVKCSKQVKYRHNSLSGRNYDTRKVRGMQKLNIY